MTNIHTVDAEVEGTWTTLYDWGKELLFCATYLIVGFPGSTLIEVPLIVQSTVLPWTATGPKVTGSVFAWAANVVLGTFFAILGVVTGSRQAVGGLAGALEFGSAAVWPW